ncbi:MAG: DUF3313 domain-containing protein [Thermodesulfobacteriota bacterium]|nr:DUF3313 domain-containing protein [Thermodesulfobacteriota bacterium]
MRKTLSEICLVVCLIILIGCAATKHAEKVERSGFLSPEIYGMMKDGNEEELEATKRYSAANVDWRTYNKIMLDPIVYFVGKRDEGEGISQEEKQRILDYFFSKLHKAIEESPFVEHATQPGPGTLRLQAAVVDLDESHVTMGAISTYIPQVSLITSIATIAKDKPAFVGEMGVEFKFTDSSTGKLLVAGIDKRYGGKKLGKGTDSWADVFNIIDYYATLLKFRVCKLQERDNCIQP